MSDATQHAQGTCTSTAHMVGFTPGPWLIWQHVDGDRSVRQIAAKRPDGSIGEWVASNVPIANAALIARAPDLLAEVQRLTAERDALRAACLEAINDCTASSCDKDRRILARGASAACVDKLRAALERSAP